LSSCSIPYCARMLTIPGARPQSGTMLMFFARASLEAFLLEHDLGVAAEVAEVNTSLDRELREIKVVVIRDRTHHGRRFAHRAKHGIAVTNVERRW